MAKWYFGTPNARQDAVLRLRSRYVAYGGARGGGKSWLVRQKAVLEALTEAGIKQLIVRSTYPELYNNHIRPLMASTRGLARYNDQKKLLYFPNGSTIQFGYCRNERDMEQYQGGEWDIEYSRQNVDSLTVSGQRYGARRAQGETTLHSLIPVNEKQRAELEASFGGGEGWFRYSQRDGTLSDRQLLAQAFEGIVRTDADKTRLHEYKKRIEELDTATAQLKSLEAELADLSSVDWAKGLELPDSRKG